MKPFYSILYHPQAIETKDLNFYKSSVEIIDSPIKLHGSKFFQSDVTTSGNEKLFLSQGDAMGRVTFLSSELNFSGSKLIMANTYFDITSKINVTEAEEVDICWSYFDGGFSSNDEYINIENADVYRIYGCQFRFGDPYVAIHVKGMSSQASFVNNNIFFDIHATESCYVSDQDMNAELSCNFHEVIGQTAYQTPVGFIDQGYAEHPIGNQFIGTDDRVPGHLDIIPETPFFYYYDQNNELIEKPIIEDDNLLFRQPAEQLAADLCKSREDIVEGGSWGVFFDSDCHTNPEAWRNIICTCPPPPPQDPPEPIGTGANGNGSEGRNSINGNSATLSSDLTTNNSGQSDIIINYHFGQIQVLNNNSNEELNIRVTNVLGHKMKGTRVSGSINEIDISDLPSGIYIVYIKKLRGGLELSHIIQHTK